MAGDVDSVGEAMAAGMASLVVEPDHGPGHSQGAHRRCLNCGAVLVGKHCHQCGQNSHVHRSLRGIGHDLMHAILHFDGKFWNTLPLLVWRPGDLTRRYVGGERASFISPLALFLFAVFLTYAVLASVGLGGNNIDAMSAAEQQQTINGARAAMAGELAEVDAKIAKARPGGLAVRETEQQRDAIIAAARGMGLVDDSGPLPMISKSAQRKFSVADVETGVPFIDSAIKKANDNPSLLLYKLQANAYKFAWALIPLSVPFLWLLFPFSRRFHLFDHFVFVTYSISFMMLWLVALRLVSFLPDAVSGPIFGIGIPFVGFHLYRQLRGAYRCSRLGAVLRSIFLTLFCFLTIVLFMMLLLAMGIMG